jgi:hypothetical protein
MLDPFDATALVETEVFPMKEEDGVNALAAVAKVARATIENFILNIIVGLIWISFYG